MQAVVDLARPWPGLTAKGTLVLPVPLRAWAPPATPLLLHGWPFQPKRELHVTLIASALGARLKAAMACGQLDLYGVVAAFARQDWKALRTGPCLRLSRPGHPLASRAGARSDSLIERITLPSMAGFHADLGRLLAADLPVPPPHVTLYTHGGEEGIGVPDEASLAALAVDFTG